ncbi:MAG: aspartate-semialdehyde dehydrogenase [Candidatus Melainabacteria bacterium]|nr:aspartate-semialdehyde dehydrogenase [Candidatus Melainabacteria bacterium]
MKNIAILGATGNVGRLLLDLIEERNFPHSSLKLLASSRSAGKTIKSSAGKEYRVELAEPSAFDGVDIVFASAGSSSSKEFAPEITKRCGVIIDNSSAFRMDPEVPLVVPEVNADDISKHKGIIANPNCSTAPLVLALKPLAEAFGLKRVVVSTYQSCSGAGKAAMDELKEASLKDEHEYKEFIHPIAYNLIPQIDVFTANDYTKEEMKLINESRKMLHLPDLAITCTAVRVPVFVSHSESVNLEFERDISIDQIKKIWSQTQSLEIMDDPSSSTYPMPSNVTGKDPVYVGRIRLDESQPNTINFWLVSDNLRIGAALNTIRIGEELVKQTAKAG